MCGVLDFANLSLNKQDAPEFWITKQEFQEEGVACLRKCGQA
jgi:hypothetical protein